MPVPAASTPATSSSFPTTAGAISSSLMGKLWRSYRWVDPNFHSLGFGAFVPFFRRDQCPKDCEQGVIAGQLLWAYGCRTAQAQAALDYLKEGGRDRREFLRLLGVKEADVPPISPAKTSKVEPSVAPAASPASAVPMAAMVSASVSAPASTPVVTVPAGKFIPADILRMRELDIISREEARAMLGLLASESSSEPVSNSISVPVAVHQPAVAVAPEEARPPRIVVELNTAGDQVPAMTPEQAWPIYQAVCRNEMIEAATAQAALQVIQSLSGEELQSLAKGQVDAQRAPVRPGDLKEEVEQASEEAKKVDFLNRHYAEDIEDSEIPF
jgi:hypothetical protein